MKKLAVLVVAVALAAPAQAEDVALIDACIGPVGAPDEHAEWCKGIVAEPCFYRKEDRSKANLLICIDAEVAAWRTIMEREYASLKGGLAPLQSRALSSAQDTWRAFLAADCAFPPIFTADPVAESWASDCRLHHTADRALALRGFRDFAVDPASPPTLVQDTEE